MTKDVLMYSDQDLIDQYLNGNEQSFEILLDRHKDKIYTSIYLFVKDDELAEDIFQDVFIKIIKSLKKG
ncbi:MAG: RNA polymerase subunit sigma-24, partial [Saprospiraceae bacterium]